MPTYVVIDDAEVAAESPITVSLMTRLRDNAIAYAGAPSGTRAMWQQTSAPLGWTKESLYDDYTPRVVTGSVGTGGSVNFSTLFGRTATDNITLTQARLPNVNFNIAAGQWTPSISVSTNAGGSAYAGRNSTPAGISGTGTNLPYSDFSNTVVTATASSNAAMIAASGGSAQAFTGAIDMRVKYIDNIIAQKD